MTNAWKISISGIEFNCDNATAKNDWARMKATWNGTEPCPNPSKSRYKSNNQCGKNTRYYSCSSAPRMTATPSSTPRNTQQPSSALSSYDSMGSVVIAITSALVIGCSWISGQAWVQIMYDNMLIRNILCCVSLWSMCFLIDREALGRIFDSLTLSRWGLLSMYSYLCWYLQ